MVWSHGDSIGWAWKWMDDTHRWEYNIFFALPSILWLIFVEFQEISWKKWSGSTFYKNPIKKLKCQSYFDDRVKEKSAKIHLFLLAFSRFLFTRNFDKSECGIEVKSQYHTELNQKIWWPLCCFAHTSRTRFSEILCFILQDANSLLHISFRWRRKKTAQFPYCNCVLCVLSNEISLLN